MRFWKSLPVTGNPKVGLAVATYFDGLRCRRVDALRCLLAAFRCQTYGNWRFDVVHDGPLVTNDLERVADEEFRDRSEVAFSTTPERKQQFGHPHRPAALQRLLDTGCDWVGLTNDDNYYAPVYLEWMLAEAQARNAELVYCDCVHSHRKWKPMACEVARGKIDLGGFLVRADLAAKIKFDKVSFAADWDWVSRLRKAAKKVAKVPATLFTHN